MNRALILSAGKGTRMNDTLPKVMTTLLGKPFLQYVVDACSSAGFDEIYPIVGYKKELIKNEIAATGFITQDELLGTGHAVQQAKSLLQNKVGVTLVIAGDQPLIKSDTIAELLAYHEQSKNDLTLLTVDNPNPYGYGRVITNGRSILKMVEEWDASKDERLVTEVNLSVYLFNNKKLFQHIHELTNTNNKQEYYINDMVGIFNAHGYQVEAYKTSRFEETIGINDKIALAEASKTLQQMINHQHMINGVTLIDPDHTYIGPDVMIGAGTIIYPNTVIEGASSVGENCRIESSYVRDSMIGNNVQVGPFAHIRQQSIIGDHNRIGNFVEVKKTKTSHGVKAAHLTYLGDTDIGMNTNIGCGVITVNYDGHHKHKTIIKDHAFIGSNVNLIAPVTIGSHAVIAAGSTITEDVPDNSLAIARERQTTKKGYYKK